jgi:LMBR1-like membrane protein
MISAFIAELIITLLVLAYMLNRYASKSTPFGVMLLVFVSWSISFSAFVGLSADVYNVMKGEKERDMDRILQVFWMIFYWSSFTLSMYGETYTGSWCRSARTIWTQASSQKPGELRRQYSCSFTIQQAP